MRPGLRPFGGDGLPAGEAATGDARRRARLGRTGRAARCALEGLGLNESPSFRRPQGPRRRRRAIPRTTWRIVSRSRVLDGAVAEARSGDVIRNDRKDADSTDPWGQGRGGAPAGPKFGMTMAGFRTAAEATRRRTTMRRAAARDRRTGTSVADSPGRSRSALRAARRASRNRAMRAAGTGPDLVPQR